MNTKLILFVLITAGLASCSTAYKMQQTPDDVYYSPTPQRNDYVQVKSEEDRNVYNEENRNVYNNTYEDREVLRRVNSRRWRKRYNDYDYGYNYPAPYGYYPYGYNPYGYGYGNYPVYVDPKTGKSPSTYKGVRKYNLGTYSKPPVTAYPANAKTGRVINAPGNSSTRTFSKPKSNNGSGAGNFIRKVFSTPVTNSDTYNNTNTTTQSRSFEPSRNSSSSSPRPSPSSSSSSGGSAPVRTFRK